MAWEYNEIVNGTQSDAASQPNALARDMKTWGGNVSAAGYKLTGLGTPTDAADAATKDYVDNAVSGGDVSGPGSSTSGNFASFADSTGKVIQDSGKATPTGAVVGDSDTQTLTGKTIDADSNTITNIGASEIEQGIIDDLTSDASPTGSTDYVMVSVSGDGLRKVLLDDLPGGGGGGGSLDVEVSGVPIASATMLNFVPGSGVSVLGSDEGGGDVDLTLSADTAVVLTREQGQSGGDLLVEPTSASSSAYAAAMSPTLTAYTEGMVVHFVPDVSNASGGITLDIDALGVVAIKQADGSADPGAADLVAGRMYPLWYDGTVFRIVQEPGGGGGGVSSVGLTMPTEFSVSGSPVTSSGTLAVTKATQSANTVYSGPTTGGAAAPTFRALVSDDLPAVAKEFSKGVTVSEPGGSEDITLWFTDVAVTITQLNAVVRGTSPSVTWTVRFDSDRSATGTEAVTGGTTTTSQTTGTEITSFDDATIPAGSWVWVETTATSGTVDEFHVTVLAGVD